MGCGSVHGSLPARKLVLRLCYFPEKRFVAFVGGNRGKQNRPRSGEQLACLALRCLGRSQQVAAILLGTAFAKHGRPGHQ